MCNLVLWKYEITSYHDISGGDMKIAAHEDNDAIEIPATR